MAACRNVRATLTANLSSSSTFDGKSESGCARTIDGLRIAATLRKEVAAEVDKLKAKYGEEAGTPGLAVVIVGQRPDSAKYVAMKKKAAKEVGFRSIEVLLPEDCSHEDVVDAVAELNADDAVDGILVQLPLPSEVNQKIVLQSIAITKDVDGFHPFNVGQLCRVGEELRQAGEIPFIPLDARNAPCTPAGALVLLEQSGCKIAGKHAVVLGRSNIVGLPAALMLLHRNATVQVCHSQTPNLKEECRRADILIAAIGRAEMVRGSWIKPGAAVIDVGINFKDDPTSKSGVRIVGDVAFDEARHVAGSLTPVPGGVGPMTVAMLMRNTVNNAKARLRSSNSTVRVQVGEVYRPRFVSGDGERRASEKSRSMSWKYGSTLDEPN